MAIETDSVECQYFIAMVEKFSMPSNFYIIVKIFDGPTNL
jgi:hypothetical protein